MNYNRYQQYKQQSVETMTKGEQLILLYDECIKRLTLAKIALEKQDYEAFDQWVHKTEDIIRYLSGVLNRDYDISAELYRIYDYFLFQMSRLRAGRNEAIIEELKSRIIELRDAFKEADKIVGKTN